MEKAVESYRRYYHLHGQMEAFVYPGIPMALEKLREAGCILAVATLKKEGFAQEMLKRMNLYPYFDMVFGTDSRDQYTKAQLLSRCLVQGRVSSGEAVLVGDSPFDGDGAREAGIDFVGVLYGFGFQTQRQALQAGAKAAAVSPPQLPHLILAGKDGERP